MKILKTPLGLWYRNGFCIVLKSTWEKLGTKNYLIQEVLHDSNNDVEFIVVNDSTKECLCYQFTDNYANFELTENKKLCRIVKNTLADFCIEKVKIQKSDLTPEQKSKKVNVIFEKYIRKKSK